MEFMNDLQRRAYEKEMAERAAIRNGTLNDLTRRLVDYGGDENGNIPLQVVFDTIKEMR